MSASEVVYVSHVRVERIRGPLRRAEVPGSVEPIYFGVHDEIADHYGDPDADRAKVERAFDHHMPRCPVYRSIGAAVEITTSLEVFDT